MSQKYRYFDKIDQVRKLSCSPETFERTAWLTGMMDAGLGGASPRSGHHCPDHFVDLIAADEIFFS